MKKIQSSLKVAVCMATVALAAMSCSQEEWAGQSGLKGNTTIVASFDGANTKTAVNGNQVVWNADDAFKLFYKDGETDKSAKFSCPTADGTNTTAKFEGTIDGTSPVASYAVYPYDNVTSLNGTTVTMTLPASFNYSVNSNGPMYARAENYTNGITFKHLAGLLKLTVTSNIATKVEKFVITADKNIAGTCTADLSKDDPVLKVNEEGASKTITVILSGATTSASTFYIPIPVGTYTKLSAQLFDDNGDPFSEAKEWTNVIVDRAGMLTSTFGFVTITADTEAGINEAISNAVKAVDVSEVPVTTVLQVETEINTTTASGGNAIAELKIPVIEKSNVALSLAKLPKATEGSPLTLTYTDGDTEQSAAANTVTLAIPEKGESETAPSLNIAMSKSSVELDATSGTATYDVVKAKTASNTLVVKKNVTVNKLIVAGGNVRVAGKIGALEKETGFTDEVTIYKEAASEDLPKNLEELEELGFTVVDADVYDMQQAFINGENYVLTADVNIIGSDITVPAGKSVILDLNGHTITGANRVAKENKDRITVYGNFTLRDSQGNGKIVVDKDYVADVYDGGIIHAIGESAHVTIESGYINTVRPKNVEGNGQYGVVLNHGADFTMTGGTIEAGWYAVSGNGDKTNTGSSTIDIRGGSLISTMDYAVFLPHEGITNISGGFINGAAGGVCIRRGTLNISGNADIRSQGDGDTGNWTSGTGNTGNSAIWVSATEAYGDCTVNISGGSMTSVKGAVLTDKASVHKTTINVSGGTFSDLSVLPYLTSNANVKASLNANNTIDSLVINKGQTLDVELNEHELNIGNYPDNAVCGKATFSNGSITQTNNTTTNGTLYVRENGDLTLDKIAMSGANYALSAQGPNVKLTVKNRSVINANYFPISTNASIKDNHLLYGENATITLSDSEFIGTETGFMNNVPAKVVISGCTFSGNHQGAFLRGGDYTIENSTFTLRAENEATHSENMHMEKWLAGNQAAFAGLTIGNYLRNDAYQYYTTVEMTKVTVNVEGTHASSFPAMHVCANDAEGKGVTITYDGTCNFTSKDYTNPVEYGTTNILVNGSAPEVNVTADK